jgi:hypothetical protein
LADLSQTHELFYMLEHFTWKSFNRDEIVEALKGINGVSIRRVEVREKFAMFFIDYHDERMAVSFIFGVNFIKELKIKNMTREFTVTKDSIARSSGVNDDKIVQSSGVTEIDEKTKSEKERREANFRYGCMGIVIVLIIIIVLGFNACTRWIHSDNINDDYKYSDPDDYNHDGKVDFDDGKQKLQDEIDEEVKNGEGNGDQDGQ